MKRNNPIILLKEFLKISNILSDLQDLAFEHSFFNPVPFSTCLMQFVILIEEISGGVRLVLAELYVSSPIVKHDFKGRLFLNLILNKKLYKFVLLNWNPTTRWKYFGCV
jgi:hypothetical protein